MKARIKKQIDKIVSMIKVIEDYNEYIEDNKYYTRYGYSGGQLSFNVKLHNVLLGDGDIEDYLDKLNIQGKYRKKILKEFNEERTGGIWNHFFENAQESFKEDLTGWDECPWKDIVTPKEVGFYGRGGGHLCLGDIGEFLLEVGDTEFGNYPIWKYRPNWGSDWSVDKPIEKLITDFKEHFGFTTQAEVLAELKIDSEKGDIKGYYDKAVSNKAALEALEEYIKDFKENANDRFHEELYYEIDIFISDKFSQKMAIELAESGDYSKLDSIKTVNETEVITSRNAKVPADMARELLKAVCLGLNVKGQRVGAYTVNKVKVKPNDTYIKIGCHLFSIKQTQLQLTA